MKDNILKFIYSLLFIFCYSFLFSQESSDYFFVTAPLNLREEPVIDSKILQIIPTGTKIFIQSKQEKEFVYNGVSGHWVKINNPSPGWIFDAYLIKNTFFNMVHINGGSFIMGSPEKEPQRESRHNGSETQHQATISEFYLGKYEVTFIEYDAYCVSIKKEKIIDNGWGRNKHPIVMISWYDAVDYCNWLSAIEGYSPVYTRTGNHIDSFKEDINWNKNANGYRLPTEAEWEYACRAGTVTAYYIGDYITTNHANYNGNFPNKGKSKSAFRNRTLPVGSFDPNPLGLFDLHGNVSEWCWDWYENNNQFSNPLNPSGPDTIFVIDQLRVIRGGDFSSTAANCRSSSRDYGQPYHQFITYGFRLARSIIEK